MGTTMRLAIHRLLAASVGTLCRHPRCVRILTYHSVQDHPDRQRHQDPRRFEQQIRYLAEHGYESFRVRDLVHRWPDILTEAPAVVLTFDDGYSNNRTIVCEILRAYGMTATFFVVSGAIGEKRRPPESPMLAGYSDIEMLSWSDLADMMEEGFEIGSHSHSHALLAALDRASAAEEIQRSRQQLEQQLGHPVCSFAYPKGHGDAFSDDTRQLLLEAGFRAACTMIVNRLTRRADLMQLPRIGILPSDDLTQFRRKLLGHYDVLPLLGIGR